MVLLDKDVIRIQIKKQGNAIVGAGQLPNAVIVISYNKLSDYVLDDPTQPGCAWTIETCYCPKNPDGSDGDQRLEMYAEYQKAGTGQEGISRAFMSRWNARTGHVEASGLSAGPGGECFLAHKPGLPDDTATGHNILTARVDGVRVAGLLEVNGQSVLRCVSVSDDGQTMVVSVGKKMFRLKCEQL